jgi:hypothetical protein
MSVHLILGAIETACDPGQARRICPARGKRPCRSSCSRQTLRRGRVFRSADGGRDDP